MAQPDNQLPFFASTKVSLSDQDKAALLARKRAHWRKVKRLTLWLLIGWAVVTFGSTYFARELNVVVLGWPFSYWMAAQGTLLVYVFIIGVYAWASHKLDLLYGLAEPQPSGEALE
jgi:putative solute:sodium symporter small subunit